MSPPVSDWFGRAHALAPGEGVDLVYGRDFDANEVELLELPDDLLAKVQSGEEELCFKGGPDDEAVLCTSDATYLVKRVETSNTLLLMQPPGGITPRDGAERASDAIAVASPDRTPSKRRRTASSAPSTPAEAIAQASAEAAAEAAAPSSALVAFAQAESHLELVRAEPKLDEMWSRLLAPPHVYKGPKGDRETDDAWYAALDDQDYGEEGVPDPPPKGIPLDALLAEARGSRAETTLALARGPAFAHEGGRYRGVDEEYLDYVVEIVIVTAEAKGWDLNGVPREAMADAMAEDGFPKDLTRLALRTFAREDEKKREEGGADGSSGSADAADAIDGAKVCASKAARMMDEIASGGGGAGAVGGGGGGGGGGARWRLGAFLEKWRLRVPGAFRDACDEKLLRGLALVEKAADGSEGTVRPFRASRLPKTPKERFAALFALKPRWTMDELEPYLEAAADQTVEAQLLKFTRVSQPNAKSTPVYSKR